MEEKDKIVFKGSHPDSLYRVPSSGVGSDSKLMRAARLMRWPAALLLVCVALAVFVYFLMPDTNEVQFAAREINSTVWSNPPGAHLQPPDVKTPQQEKTTTIKPTVNKTGIRTAEIDFYDSGAEVNKEPPTIIHTIPDLISNRNLPAPPVYPSYIVPEVQYGNERADSGKGRASKALPGQLDKQPEDSTLKPHITQKPEKPLAIYFKDGAGLTTTSAETIANAETSNIDYQGKSAVSKDQYNNKFSVANKINPEFANEKPKFYPEVPDLSKQPVQADVHFTSGHSKLFGISIEDAEKIKSTTPSSIYNTRVSPTLPVLRDIDDTTTKYPVIINADVSDVLPQCSSTQLPMCRGVLPYDLTSASSDVSSLLPQFEYLLSRNCSDRARQFACIILEPECSPPPLKPRPPCHDLCKGVMDGCEGHIPQDLLAVMECHRYPQTKCVKPRSPCFERELTCGDGTCVPRDWICDGNKDCPAGEDEAECLKCSNEEFKCLTGECISKQWLCDGYSDCTQGDDEVEATCASHKVETRAEIGEESAGSAPAPAVRRPGRIPAPQHLRQIEPYRGDDSSRELLMTSDTSNPYRRNYTRRPATSRLTPYKRPIVKDLKPSLNDSAVETKNIDKNTNSKQTLKDDSIEDMVLGDINFYNEYEKKLTNEDQGDKRRGINSPALKKLVTGEYGRAPPPMPESEFKTRRITRLEKNLNKFERIIDGDKVIRKNTPKTTQESVITAEDPNSQEADRYNETLITAHASPCPSSELRCVDGRCITLAQLCDGTIDCSDHADEDNCFT